MPLTKRALQLACVFLLLFAQQAAVTHAVWHAQAPASQQQDTKGKAAFQGGLCDLHGVFTQVLGGVHSACAPTPHAPALNAHIVHRPPSWVAARHLIPLSRGPPVLL
jgi:hypothetical protein